METECAHVGQTGKGMRQKCSDYETIPLCGWHHTISFTSYHRMDGGPKAFLKFYSIKIKTLFRKLRAQYAAERGK